MMADKSRIKTVFMGTPDFAVPSLEALIDIGCDIGYVLTQPDKVRDRGKKVSYTPVKQRALESDITVLQPERVRGNDELIEQIGEYAPDLMVVAAYGQILPRQLLDVPRLGCINVHASLLPRFRGASPIQHAIIEGDEETGVTIMKVEEALDAGNMLARASISTAGKTGGELHDELAVLGAELLADFVSGLDPDGEMPEGEAQDEELATYAPMIFKSDGLADFTMEPDVLERRIRALDPWPGVFTYYTGRQMKIWGADICSGDIAERYRDAECGQIVDVSDDGIYVRSGSGVLRITSLQMPGKKRVAVRDHLRGNSIETGIVLGE